MISNFSVHNIKISLKLKVPNILYLNDVIKETKIKYKNFGNFLIVYSDFTYTFFNTINNIVHCNITKIKKYDNIYTSKKKLKTLFPKLSILTTKVDNICGTRNIGGKINLEGLFASLIKCSAIKFRINYNSQKFPGLFIKFLGHSPSGTLIVFKSGKINCVGLKRPNNLLELDEWIDKWVHHV